jgi:CheY-like chemotaxis protein
MHDLKRPRVLIVDDERAFADVVAELLEEEGYHVIRAYDGITAIQMLSPVRIAPDVILCDVMLPGLSGDRLAAEVRRLFPKRRLPVVLLSASADPHVHLRDVWFLAKPFDLPDLLQLLDGVVRPAARAHTAAG